MSDGLELYYRKELDYIRNQSAAFARRPENSKIASRLGILADGAVGDPHVECLIQAFAYVNARTRRKLDDDFPEITEALLGIMYPHYLAPIPSLAVVRLELDPSQTALTEPDVVRRHTYLETVPVRGHRCTYRTCYETRLWPLAVKSINFSNTPLGREDSRGAKERRSHLSLKLETFKGEMRIEELDLATLRFFISGQDHNALEIYELLFNRLQAVELVDPEGQVPSLELPAECLRPVGFDPEDALLPYMPRSFLGYRLLTEYFALPDKFLFFDLTGLTKSVLAGYGPQLEVVLHFRRTAEGLTVKDRFHLGCTPVVNLFKDDPPGARISLDHTRVEYPVIPDPRHTEAHEVYTIDRVTATTGEEFAPFFSFKHATEAARDRMLWYSRRRAREDGDGTQVYMAFADLEFSASEAADQKVLARTTCLNRNLPSNLTGDPRFQIIAKSEEGERSGSQKTLVSKVTCLTPPSRTLRPPLRSGTVWRIISHLASNHLPLTESDASPEALREILMLYDFRDSDDTRDRIATIKKVSCKRGIARVDVEDKGLLRRSTICRGVDIEIVFERTFKDSFADNGLFLFASVLERFLGLYCAVNSFTRLTARIEDTEGTLRTWKARSGHRVLH